jgi:hypothetical protein
MDNGRAGQIIRFTVRFLGTKDNLMPGHKVGRVSRMLNTALIDFTPRATSSSGIPAKEFVKQSDNSSFRGVGNPGGPPRPTARGSLRVPRAYRLWLLLFVGLQIGDIVTTNHALALPGVWEANPLMAWSQAQLGAFWWLPKLAVVGYLSLSASFMRRRWPMIFAVSVSGLCVLGNLANF